jgi:hypothetical protein
MAIVTSICTSTWRCGLLENAGVVQIWTYYSSRTGQRKRKEWSQALSTEGDTDGIQKEKTSRVDC